MLRNNGWKEAAYALLAQHFGLKINSNPFLHLSEVLVLKVLPKHPGSLLSMEALLFDHAGFLDQPVKGPYCMALKKEYEFFVSKYLNCNIERGIIKKGQHG